MNIPEGTAVGSIVVGPKLADGELGDLYRARQPGLERDVVIRVLRRDLVDDTTALDKFRREARLGARVRHPNVVHAIDYFSLRDDHYLVLEHVEGTDLRSVLERKERVPPRVVARLVLELAHGIAEMHARGVLHTDLRPENVLISRFGEAKIKGLGAARESGEEPPESPPTPTPYAAPELARGARAEARADVFSLGALLFELLYGTRANEADANTAPADRALTRIAGNCLAETTARRLDVRRLIRDLSLYVRETDPGSSRAEIAAWLWAERLLRPARGLRPPNPADVRPHSTPRPARPQGKQAAGPRRSRSRRRPSTRRQQIAAGLAAAALPLLGGGWLLFGGGGEAPGPEIPAVSSGGASLAAPGEASVTFTAHPWAEIQVDEHTSFLTPRAKPLALAAGRHRVVFRHPSYGEVTREFVLKPGEERLVRHSFELDLEYGDRR